MASLVTTTLTGDLSVSSTFTALNSARFITTISSAGSYTWGNIFKTYWQNNGYFSTAVIYNFWIVSSNDVHYSGHQGILSAGYLIGANGYGGETLDWGVSNIINAAGPWIGGCGASPFSSIDTSGFTFQLNACSESASIYAKEIF